MKKQKITPFLWFNDDAEGAINHYVNVFDNSKINHLSRAPDGKVFTGSFQLNGHNFAAMNGGPLYKINPATSFFVVCETASEVDTIWAKLMEGGQALMALDTYPWSAKYGWGQDRFGLSWQVMLGNKGDKNEQFFPCLMFAGDLLKRADEAVDFYVSTFENAKIDTISRYTEGEPAPLNAVKHARFEIENQTFSIMGSPIPHNFNFNEAISFVVNCTTQKEVDYYWNALISDGGAEGRCGWLKDKFGISWQIIPKALMELMGDKDPVKSQNVMQAMLKMNKIIIVDLEKAHQKTN